MRVALAQISSTAEPSANLALVRDAVTAAAADGARLVVFPEATMCRFGVPLGPIAEPLDGPWADAVAAIAADHAVTVIAGMFTPATDPSKVRNTLLVASPDGQRAGYDKIHLYDAYGFAESDTVEPGAAPMVVTVDDVLVGVTTCYDLRFPNLYTALADAGAQLITVSASWGAGPGKSAAWELLARARALDSTTFIAAAGQALPAGLDAETGGGAPLGVGRSIAVGPDGRVLLQAGSGPAFHTVDLHIATVDAVRRTLPVLANATAITRPQQVRTR